jgi:hypothetical protein
MPFGYALSGTMPDSVRNRAVALLRLHGIRVRQLQAAWSGPVDVFTVSGIRRGTYENFATTALTGTWSGATRTIPPGAFVVSAVQPLAVLAVYLLEPESDDGIATYTIFDASLSQGAEFPVVRLGAALPR